MVSKEETLRLIRKELADAGEARRAGNEGMVRVCARRAAGAAIAFWELTHPQQAVGSGAMDGLRSIQHDGTMPSRVREAASRLVAKVRPDFTPATPIDPIDDCKLIVDHLLAL